jgi:hypothetical protein
LVTPSVFVTDRFAEVRTAFESVAVLSAVSGSLVEEVAVTESTCGLSVVEDGTVYVIVLVAEPPLTIVPSAQVKSGPAPASTQPSGSEPRLKPVGHVSANETACASEGPALWTVIVYVRVTPSPAVTSVTPSVLVTDRFAEVRTVFESVAVLSVESGSLVVEVAVAELTCGLAVVEDGTV